MPAYQVKFEDISLNTYFRFEGDKFRKTDIKTAWEVKNDRNYKEWAFQGDELCMVISPVVDRNKHIS